MRTYIRRLTPLHYRSIKDIFEVFYREGLCNMDLSYYWRYRDRRTSIGTFNADGDLLGFALLMDKATTPNNLYLSFIATHSRFSDYGLGSKMMQWIVAGRRNEKGAVHLISLDSPRLQAWYMKHGFRSTYDRYYMNLHSYGTRSYSR